MSSSPLSPVAQLRLHHPFTAEVYLRDGALGGAEALSGGTHPSSASSPG